MRRLTLAATTDGVGLFYSHVQGFVESLRLQLNISFVYLNRYQNGRERSGSK